MDIVSLIFCNFAHFIINTLTEDLFISNLAEHSFALWPNFIDDLTAKALREQIEQLRAEDDLKKAGIGTGDQFMIAASVRGDFIKWIDQSDASPALTVFNNAISKLIQSMNRHLYLGIKDSEFHFTVYPPNTRYEKHLDQLQAHDHRRISAILYLNENWSNDDGGILRLYPPDKDTIDVLPLGGQLVCFQSDVLPHEVLEVHKDRYSITGWLLDQPKSLNFL